MAPTIEPLSPAAAPATTQAPVKGPSVPADGPDLRETQIGVTPVDGAAPPAAAFQKSAPEKELEAAINERLARVLRTNIQMQIEVDKGTGNFVYKSVDKKTGAVDRQFPAEEVLRMLAFLNELDGLLFDQKA